MFQARPELCPARRAANATATQSRSFSAKLVAERFYPQLEHTVTAHLCMKETEKKTTVNFRKIGQKYKYTNKRANRYSQSACEKKKTLQKRETHIIHYTYTRYVPINMRNFDARDRQRAVDR